MTFWLSLNQSSAVDIQTQMHRIDTGINANVDKVCGFIL